MSDGSSDRRSEPSVQKKAIPKAVKPEAGVKYDEDKARMELIPPWAELEIAKVLTFGAKKYSPDNWRKVPDLQNRYMGALRRHVNAIQRGEVYDLETGFYHHAHAMCCLMFLLEDLILTTNDKE